MFLLAALTRERGIKVVLTGEGSDEMFLGYDLFKEVVVRQFCLRLPASRVRPRLFDRLYPYLAPEGRAAEFWRRSFIDAGPLDDPLFSHLPRMRNATWIKSFYGEQVRSALSGFDAAEELRGSLPAAFASWSPLERADYLEIVTLMSGYLLSSQGDRVAMAHGVEGRYPFLDHRLASFAGSLPTRSRLRGLHEKDILRRWAAGVVPPVVNQRPKQPYRAPDAPAFFGAGRPAYVDEVLEPGALAQSGLFDPAAVQGLRRRAEAGQVTSSRENQALVGILSAELWHREFCRRPAAVAPLATDRADVCLVEAGNTITTSSRAGE
jgi:asparagine synthase (glutamine-hydrolysing)